MATSSCGSSNGNGAPVPQQINEPSIEAITPVFETQTERINNCDGTNPNYVVSYTTIEAQKATFEVTVGAGGMVTGTPLPTALEVQLEAKISAALAKDYGITTEKGHEITLENPIGSYLEHTITWKVTKIKGLIDVVYGDGTAEVAFDKVANVELYDRTSTPVSNCNEVNAGPSTPIATEGSPVNTSLASKIPEFSNGKVLYQDSFDINALSGWDNYLVDVFVEQGFLTLSGKNTWEGIIGRSEKIQENEASLIEFKYSPNTEFEAEVATGDFQTSSWRVWGVFGRGDRYDINIAQGTQNINGNTWEGNLKPAADVWYVALFYVGDNGDFTTRIWERDNPSQYIELKKSMGNDWANRGWYFGLDILTGKLTIDTYQEISLK
jgi:hypothetical protein